jgi:hypothetical protein
MIQTIAPMNDLRAIQVLLRLLDDPSLHTAIVVAEGLNRLGPLIRSSDPVLASQVASTLRRFMDARGRQPGNEDFRAACVEALVPLGDPLTRQTYLDLLRSLETPRTRRAALAGLAAVADPRDANTVLSLMSSDAEKDPTVRLAAMDAFSHIGSVGSLSQLYSLMQPSAEPDPAVREKAWQVFQGFLPRASREELGGYAQRFFAARDFKKRLGVQLALAEMQAKDVDRKAWAVTEENIGNDYLAMQPPQPEQAAPHLRLALNWWRDHNDGGQAMAGVTRELAEALLGSRQYAEVAKLADETIARDPGQQQSIGAQIADAAEQLNVSRQHADAIRLVEAVLKMNTPLRDIYRKRLEDVRAQAQAILGPSTPATGQSR